MKTETLKKHAVSAALTFASTLGVEVLIAMNAATDWSGLGWAPLLSAASFTAARAVLKVLLGARKA
jgi:nitrogen fixation protein FixH